MTEKKLQEKDWAIILNGCAESYRKYLDRPEALKDLLTSVELSYTKTIVAGIKERKLMTEEEIEIVEQALAQIVRAESFGNKANKSINNAMNPKKGFA